MGLRRMTGVERNRVRALAASLLFGGEGKDSVVGEMRRYLVGRGWEYGPASHRAHEVYHAAPEGPPPGERGTP